VHTVVHRFEEIIGDRAYQIEVAPIETDRWRAYIVRVPGVPTALMPFYGVTPTEAAANLREWLMRAHLRVAASKPKATA
jgi:IS1 family transposase